MATAAKIKDCTVSNVNDTTGIGTVTYLRGDGNTVSANETLVKENDTWKINAQQIISTPTETLLTYCDTGATLHHGRLTFYKDIKEAVASYNELVKMPVEVH